MADGWSVCMLRRHRIPQALNEVLEMAVSALEVALLAKLSLTSMADQHHRIIATFFCKRLHDFSGCSRILARDVYMGGMMRRSWKMLEDVGSTLMNWTLGLAECKTMNYHGISWSLAVQLDAQTCFGQIAFSGPWCAKWHRPFWKNGHGRRWEAEFQESCLEKESTLTKGTQGIHHDSTHRQPYFVSEILRWHACGWKHRTRRLIHM